MFEVTNITLALMGIDLKQLESMPPKEQRVLYSDIKRLIEDRVAESKSKKDLEIVKFEDE